MTDEIYKNGFNRKGLDLREGRDGRLVCAPAAALKGPGYITAKSNLILCEAIEKATRRFCKKAWSRSARREIVLQKHVVRERYCAERTQCTIICDQAGQQLLSYCIKFILEKPGNSYEVAFLNS